MSKGYSDCYNVLGEAVHWEPEFPVSFPPNHAYAVLDIENSLSRAPHK